jgi:hypothetical protein
MTMKVYWPHTDFTRVFKDMNQAQVNAMINHLSNLEAEVKVEVTVS